MGVIRFLSLAALAFVLFAIMPIPVASEPGLHLDVPSQSIGPADLEAVPEFTDAELIELDLEDGWRNTSADDRDLICGFVRAYGVTDDFVIGFESIFDRSLNAEERSALVSFYTGKCLSY